MESEIRDLDRNPQDLLPPRPPPPLRPARPPDIPGISVPLRRHPPPAAITTLFASSSSRQLGSRQDLLHRCFNIRSRFPFVPRSSLFHLLGLKGASTGELEQSPHDLCCMAILLRAGTAKKFTSTWCPSKTSAVFGRL